MPKVPARVTNDRQAVMLWMAKNGVKTLAEACAMLGLSYNNIGFLLNRARIELAIVESLNQEEK